MPPIPRWYADLPEIRRRLNDWDESVPLDRKAIEELFGLKPRQAIYLMTKFKGYAIGQSIALNRLDLIARIDEMAAPGGLAAAKIQEKKRELVKLKLQAQMARPKKIPPPPPPPTPADLPAGIRIVGHGQLLIEYSSPEDLLSRHLALSQTAIKDFGRFAAALEYIQPRNGDCTVDETLQTPLLAGANKGQGS